MKLLLHICCGPCAIYPISVIKEQNIYFEGYFYNPNIHPLDEFYRRYENAKIVANSDNFILHYNDEFKQDEWQNFNGTQESRCFMCYDLRLKETAMFASKNNFDAFSTSLLVSPYQNHDMLVELGEKYAKETNIKFYYYDFREGFRKGQTLAKEAELYRQKYCGCIKSLPISKLSTTQTS